MARMAPKPSKTMWKLVDTYDLWSGHLSGLNSGSAMLLLAIVVAGRPANSTVATSIQVGKLHGSAINLHPGKYPNNRHQGNNSNPHFGNETAWLHAPTILSSMWHLAKAKSLQLSTWTWPSANCRLLFLFTESHVLSLGLKMHWSKSVESCNCDQRSWPSFHPWSHRNCRTSAITSLPLGDILSVDVFSRIPGSKMDHANTSCSISLLVCWTDMSLQSQEPQLQSVVRNAALA